MRGSNRSLGTGYEIAEFGVRATAAGQPNANPFQYTGRENDGTGLYYYWARYYHPVLQRFISEDPIELDGVNPYLYVFNTPLSYTDPLGQYAFVDDAIFALGGALFGLGGQAVGDWVFGRRSSWRDYAGAAIGGAAGGVSLLYTGPVGAGAIGSATTNVTKQLLVNTQCPWSLPSLVFDTSLGAFAGSIGGKAVSGITTGRGSWNSIYKQVVTKFLNGTISSVRPVTAGKMFVGRAVDTGAPAGLGVSGILGSAGIVENSCACR